MESDPDRAWLDPELLNILCCPETRQGLRVASSELVASLNRRIGTRNLRQRDQQEVIEPIDGGFVREDGRVLYPVRKGILILLINQGIPLEEQKSCPP